VTRSWNKRIDLPEKGGSRAKERRERKESEITSALRMVL